MKITIPALLLWFVTTVAAAITADERLMQVPKRIQDFRERVNYAKYENTADELDKKWQYARFLEHLIEEINQEVASGGALSQEEIRAIGSFARVTVMLRDDYLPSTFRGSSGFESREVNAMIALHEKVIQDLIPGIGKHLSLFQKTEKDWDSAKINAWRRRFIEATKIEQDGPANGSQPIRSETNTTSSAAGSRR